MFKQDEAKTAFTTDTTNYWYSVMPFGLKNVGAMSKANGQDIHEPI